MVVKKQTKKTVKPVIKKQTAKKAPCKKVKCVKPMKVSVTNVQEPQKKKCFWTKVKEFLGF